MRRLILLISVGWLPPYLPPSGACLCLGSSVLSQPLNAVEGDTKPGLRLCRCTLGNLLSSWLNPLYLLGLRCYGDLSGNGPHESSQLTGNGHGHDIGVFASCHEAPVTFTEPHLGFPTDVLDDFGLCFEAQLQMSADFRGRAIGPGAFDEDASGMAVARFGNRPLSALLPGGVFGGDQAQEFHQFSWGIKPCQVTHFRHQGYGHREWHATQGLQSLDHRVQTPG
jgi:hypothetical protein